MTPCLTGNGTVFLKNSVNGALNNLILYFLMLDRIQDRIASVRVQAIIALQRLQDPTNKECPVIKVIVSMSPLS